jgi:acyl carrier protein
MSNGNGPDFRIRSFILEKFPAARKRGLNDELPLLEAGIVDSLGVLDVIGFLEQTFHIKIDDDELMPDNFANVRSMVAFVERKTRTEISPEYMSSSR